MMKLGTYNFAITPGEFPFFYDKDLWLDYLDFLAENRFNYIAFWNGHPFDYFVKLDKYPEAQKGMPVGLLEKNHEMLSWLCAEALKRNIRFIFQFYNIHTSIYFQKAHNLKDEIAEPTPLLADYTEHCIERFVSEFPEVGLYVTPGEGLDLEHSDRWINEVIFPAVNKTGKTPPIFVRAWQIDLPHARKVVGNYENLYWERKFNVEMIADTRIDPENEEWAALNGNYIVNIHCIANLEPFRWNPPSYIRQCIQSSLDIGAKGLHLYPRKAWRWPYGSDTGKNLLQWERDALWFEMWGRYAWRVERDTELEKNYWISRLSKRFGSQRAAIHFLNSFEAGADVLPGLQRLLWLGNDNHTIVAAGAKLTHIEKAPGTPLFEDIGCLRIPEYLEKIKRGEVPDNGSPIDFLAVKIAEAERAVLEAQWGISTSLKNKEEASRILSDATAILLISKFYYNKLRAIVFKLLYENNINFEQNKEQFIENLEASVNNYRDLTILTDLTYASLSDVPAKHPERLEKCPYHWSDILPLFEKELEIYRQEVNQPMTDSYFKPSLPGLAGIWYGDPDLQNPDHSFTAEVLDYKWDNKEEDLGRNWSVQWFGFIRFPESGVVKLKVASDRGVILKIENNDLIAWEGSIDERIASFKAEKNHWYRIDLIYNHEGGDLGQLNVQWQLPESGFSAIIGEYLKHSPQQKQMMEKENKLISGEKNE